MPQYKADIIKIPNLDVLADESNSEETIEDNMNDHYKQGYELSTATGLTQSQSGAYYVLLIYKKMAA